MMTLIEAIKSGKRFKRKEQPGLINVWLSVNDREEICMERDGSQYPLKNAIMSSHIIADDWIIDEPTVTIGLTQFIEACKAVVFDTRTSAGEYGKSNYWDRENYIAPDGRGSFLLEVAENLGLDTSGVKTSSEASS